MITLLNVTKKFKSNNNYITALNNISLTIKKGEIVGFLGPNGAGKTTTMRLIVGYLNPTSGTITINNQSIFANRLSLLSDIGYLPENNPQYIEMTVGQYLRFIQQVKQVDNIEDIISTVGLLEVVNKKIEELSRGFKQRVGLAASLIDNPSILLLDEPTSGLDPIEQDKIKSLIKKISKNKIIIFSTHILTEVEDVANRLVIINQGKIVYDGRKPTGKGSVEKLFKKIIKTS